MLIHYPPVSIHAPREGSDDIPAPEVLEPWSSWSSRKEYDKRYKDLAMRFIENFAKFDEGTTKDVLEAGPKV